MKKIIVIAVLCAFLPACAGLGGIGQTSMSAEQLKAAASDKNASAVCATGTGPWGKVNSVYVNVDRSSIVNGTVSVDAECKVSVTTGQKAP